MFGEPAGVLLRTPTGGLRSLGTGALREVGFAGDEGIYSEPAEGALGYRLLQEYFAFPEKFLFVDVQGLGALARSTDNSFEILVLQRESDTALANKDLRRNLLLGCVPVVNLFAMSPAPIRDDGRHIEYRVMPDHRAPLHYEVHSVRSVAASRPGVPGMRESGVEGYDVSFWFGWNAPAGTPDATAEWLNQQLNELLREPAAQAIIRDQFGADTVGGSRADFGRHIASEMQVYEDLIRTAHIKLDD